jgi:hypothetical protein
MIGSTGFISLTGFRRRTRSTSSTAGLSESSNDQDPGGRPGSGLDLFRSISSPSVEQAALEGC